MTLSPNYCMMVFVSWLRWYEALSSNITVLSRQSGLSQSKAFVNESKNIVIVFESVLAWLNENQTRPSESRAAIIDSRGVTALSLILPLPSRGAQVFREWLVSFIHVSSILTIVLRWLSCFKTTRADCYHRTSDRSEFACGLSFLALRKLSSKSVFRTCLTNFKLTACSVVSLTIFWILAALSIAWLYSLHYSTASLMAYRCSQINFSRSFAALSFSGFFLHSDTRSRTSCTVTRWRCAISFWGTYYFSYSSTIASCSVTDSILRCLGR